MRISGQSILAYARPEAMQGGSDPIAFQGLNAGGAEGQFGYDIPNVLIDYSMRNPHVPPWFWRGVNNNQNAIYLECFIDELAHAAGQDPLAFRRKMMSKHPKHLAVLNAVAERVGWDKPAPAGIFRGLCQHMGYGSYVAAAAEVSVKDNNIKMHRIVAATNPGHAVNPAQIERQIAGSFVYGLSALFHGGITIKDGAVVETNFDTYGSIRMSEMPHVESIIIPTQRFLGRRRRAYDLRGGACGAERDLRGDGQALSFVPAEELRSADRVIGVDRRGLIKAAAACAAAAAFPKPSLAQGRARVVIVGGGFGGTSCARALRQLHPKMAVTLVEANPVYRTMLGECSRSGFRRASWCTPG